MADRRALPLLALLWLATPARAAEEAQGALLLYEDDDHVSVTAAQTRLKVDVGPLALTAGYGVDVVSAASVDLVSAASPGGYSERRRELEGKVEAEVVQGGRLGGGWSWSDEPDFTSHTLSLGHAQELIDRRLTLALGLALTAAEISRARDDAFLRERWTRAGQATASWVLTPVWAAELLASVALVEGFQANPYRFVRLWREGAELHGTAVAEVVPERRLRSTVGARLRGRPWLHTFTTAGYEYYADDWGVGAHALEARAAQGLFDELLFLSLEARGYVQDGADFWRPRYDTLPMQPVLRTAEQKLGPMSTLLVGGRLELSPPLPLLDAVRVGVGAQLYHLRFPESLLQESRTARLFTFDLLLQH